MKQLANTFIGTVRDVISTYFALRDSFIAAPYAFILANVGLATLLSMVTSNSNADLLDQGIRMAAMVSGASISIVTLTFSLTVLSVQIASQSYSPRLLDAFLRDPISKVVISVNLGAYAYCFTMNYFLYDSSPDPAVPYLAINFLSVHMFLVLAAFVAFIHFFINGFRLENILHRAQQTCLEAAHIASADFSTAYTQADFPNVPSSAYKVTADQSGYVKRFRLEQICSLAREMDVYVRYNRHIGEFVAEGTVLAHVWDAQTREDLDPLQKRVKDNIQQDTQDENIVRKDWDDVVEEKLGIFVSNGVVLSKKRSGLMDITLGIQQLSDTAMRALSPGINDPQTAIQCMDVLAVVLGRLIDMEMGVPAAEDKDGNLRVWGPRRSFSFLLSMLDGIRHYGGSDLAVCRRGIRLFGDLGAILIRRDSADNRIPTVRSQMEQWLNVAKENFSKNNPELVSIQNLYDHELEQLIGSESRTVQKNESVEGDTQKLDITHNEDPEDENDTSSKDVGVAQKIFDTVTSSMS